MLFLLTVAFFQYLNTLRDTFMRLIATKQPHLSMGRKGRRSTEKEKLKRQVLHLNTAVTMLYSSRYIDYLQSNKYAVDKI